jgi:hypothetical protein
MQMERDLHDTDDGRTDEHPYETHPREALEAATDGDEVRIVVDNDEYDGGTEKTLDGLYAEFVGVVMDADVEPRAADDGVDVRVWWEGVPEGISLASRESPVGAHLFDEVWAVDVEFDFGGDRREYYLADEFEVVR